MALIIVESPNKIPKIQKAVGSGYTVMASVGHIMDLEKKDMGIEIPSFKVKYKINDDKKDVVKRLKDEADKHDEIFIATDDDREGEAIAYNLKEILPKRGKKVERVIFKTITKTDIMSGLNNPIGFREDLYNAQQARRITDRIVGFKVSPLMWSRGLRNTSAGRVQSAALKFVVDREREIRSFTIEEYWTINVDTDLDFKSEFVGIDGEKIEIKNKKESDDIVKNIKGKLKVSSYSKKTRTRSPQPPFITSTMQKDAGTKFGWSSQKVMDMAQKLFGAGLITYHRTDSIRTEQNKLDDIRDRIKNQYGNTYLSSTAIMYAPAGGAQDAHEAIRPTFEPIPPNLDSDEKKLLELITNRFTASQMADAIFDQVQVKFELSSAGKIYDFKAAGSVKTFDGFLKVYGSAAEDLTLPSMKVGDSIGIKKVNPEQHFTKPPARFTEPAFTERMEKEGIGRPATYAATIETLIKRGYATREVKSLKPTEIGIMVCEYLEVYFKELTSSDYTSKMESELDEIAGGKSQLNPIMDKFYNGLMKLIDSAKSSKNAPLFKTEIVCSKCNDGSVMVKKISSFGPFLSCQKYPECGHTISYDEDGKPKESEVETGHACPSCGDKVIKRKSKYSEFYGCSSYPTCTWSGNIGEDGKIVEKKKSEKTEHKCPNCKDGYFVKRKGKDSDFYGCSGYPKCKTSASIAEDGSPTVSKKSSFKKKESTAKSIGEKCPKCKTGELSVRDGKFGKFISCGEFRNGCKYTRKVE